LYRAAEVLQAGDTVLVKAGTYVAQEGCSWSTPAINPSNSGTATQPIVFRAYPGHNVVVTNSVTDHGCPPLGTNRRDYIVIDGFEVDVPASKGVVVFHSTGTVIQNNVIHGMRGPGGDNTDGIRVEDSNAITLRNNVIYDIRNGSNTLNAAAVKIYYSSGVVVEHNEVYGLVAGLRNKAGGSDNVFRYNWVHDCEMKGIDLDSNNGRTARNLQAYGNIVAGCDIGISIGGSDNSPGYDIIAYNNTLVGNNDGITVSRTTHNAQVWNNIIYNSGHRNLNDANAGLSYCDYNLYFRSKRGCGSHNVVADPQFAGMSFKSPLDFKLGVSSPARGAGRDRRNIGAYANGNDIIGVRGREPK
jgi:hypothetical protein